MQKSIERIQERYRAPEVQHSYFSVGKINFYIRFFHSIKFVYKRAKLQTLRVVISINIEYGIKFLRHDHYQHLHFPIDFYIWLKRVGKREYRYITS